MANKRQRYEVADLISRQQLVIGDGYRAKNDELGKHGLPFARAGNINEGFQFADADRFPMENRERLGNKVSQPGDVVFTSKGTVGRFAYVREVTPQFVYSPQLCFWRSLDRNAIDSRFLYYWMYGREFYIQFKGVAGQTDMAEYVSLTDQRRMHITLPDVDEQRSIVRILGTLDDKIELNRRMNRTLEKMARALFRSWFVDFDPVRAKAEGRNTGLPQLVADLFPDSFTDSELGKIPNGWVIGKLGDVLSIIETGGRPKGGVKDFTEGVPSVGAESIVGIGHFDYGKTKFVPREFFEGMKRGHVQHLDVLLYKDGGRPGVYEPHLTIVGDEFPFVEFCINEHVYRLRTEPALPQTYLFFWLSSASAMEEMRTRGTGVAIPGLNSTAVRELAVLKPSVPVLDAFENNVSPIVQRILCNCKESRTLAVLRDTLLPKLISGELRLPDAERFMGGQV
jgi:type I restriction enzyme S subunit